MPSAADVKMSENPVPETLETIAAKIDALGRSMAERFDAVDQRFVGMDNRFTTVDERLANVDERFTKVDERFNKVDERFTKVDERLTTADGRFKSIDQQLVEMKAQLGVKIEAVDAKVVKVYDAVIAMREKSKRNATEHKTFEKRLDNHDVRLLALEKPGPAKP
jgi:chromosome segregation ATPase